MFFLICIWIKGQEIFIEALNLVNKELGDEPFYAIILGSDQGRDIYSKKIKNQLN